MTGETNEWDSYWRERGESAMDDAVRRDPGLARLWEAFFAGAPMEGAALDIACGDGAVLRRGFARRGADLRYVGVDIAPDALDRVRRDTPAEVVCARFEHLPFADGAFAAVVSQFGVEYGGGAAFVEAARLVGDGGRLLIVAHYSGGSIAREASAKLEELDALEAAPGFIPAAREFFAAVFAVERDGVAQREGAARFQRAADRFHKLLQTAASLGAAAPDSLAARLCAGAKALFDNRAGYAKEDVFGWLDAMQAAMESGRTRARALTDAALDEEGARRVASALNGAGLTLSPPRSFTLEGRDVPAAWIFEARHV